VNWHDTARHEPDIVDLFLDRPWHWISSVWRALLPGFGHTLLYQTFNSYPNMPFPWLCLFLH
jgi:hypothetical protein